MTPIHIIVLCFLLLVVASFSSLLESDAVFSRVHIEDTKRPARQLGQFNLKTRHSRRERRMTRRYERRIERRKRRIERRKRRIERRRRRIARREYRKIARRKRKIARQISKKQRRAIELEEAESFTAVGAPMPCIGTCCGKKCTI